MRTIALLIAIIACAFVVSATAGPRPRVPESDPRVQAIRMLPGLYRVASQGGLVCDTFLVLTPEPVLIDCGSRPGWDQLTGNLALLGLTVGDLRWVIATHGHWDHVDNMARIRRENPRARFAIHAGDAQFVIDNDRVFSCAEPLYKGVASDPIRVDRILLDGDVIRAGRSKFRIIHTPGHTPGSVTIVTEIAGKKVGFCGDSVTGYYSETNRSNVIDWQNSMKRLMTEDLDMLFAGHRKKPVAGKSEIHEYLTRALDAATYKRSLLSREEPYDDLVYLNEHRQSR